MLKRLGLLTLCASLLGIGCSSTTIIHATPADAKIYIDDEYRGVGSVTYSDQKIIGSTTRVRIEKPGCETFNSSFSRNEEFDAGACAGGVFLLFPFLWIEKYKANHDYALNCKTSSNETSPVGASPLFATGAVPAQ